MSPYPLQQRPSTSLSPLLSPFSVSFPPPAARRRPYSPPSAATASKYNPIVRSDSQHQIKSNRVEDLLASTYPIPYTICILLTDADILPSDPLLQMEYKMQQIDRFQPSPNQIPLRCFHHRHVLVPGKEQRRRHLRLLHVPLPSLRSIFQEVCPPPARRLRRRGRRLGASRSRTQSADNRRAAELRVPQPRREQRRRRRRRRLRGLPRPGGGGGDGEAAADLPPRLPQRVH